MLPAASRLRQRSDFAATMRSGRRAARPRLVVHLALPDLHIEPGLAEHADRTLAGPRAGFVVGRQVGGAVVRNRVRRQLQHLSADRLAELPAGARLVVRALPAAAGSSARELAADLDAALARSLAGQLPHPRPRQARTARGEGR
ncbi:MAG TPA: ribonuclease P protein component [Acidothermaceae bacterium]|nr:ribonuclease P protein component [Acidothermaceae bacterium]